VLFVHSRFGSKFKVQSLELLESMNNKIMQLMGRNEWDTPNVRRACKGAFEPQDRLQKDARQKRAKADKPFYNLLKDCNERARELAREIEHEHDKGIAAQYEWFHKCEKLEKQIKSQKTRIKNLLKNK